MTAFISEAITFRAENEWKRWLSELISTEGAAMTPMSMASMAVAIHVFKFDIWAERSLVGVVSDADLRLYDAWLVRYGQDFVKAIECTNDPEKGTIAAGLQQALHGRIGYWKSIARKQLREQEEAGTSAQFEKTAGVVERAIETHAEASAESPESEPLLAPEHGAAGESANQVFKTNLEIALRDGKRKEASEIWKAARKVQNLPATKVALYNEACQDKAEYYRWERGELKEGSQADEDIRRALFVAFR
jgi:hypothetical protein